jgi:restriction endonuclease S subunit
MSDGWTETTLGEVSTFETARLSPEQLDSGNRYVGLEHLDSKQPLVTRWGTVGDVTSQVTPFNDDDVLFGRLRPYLHKVATPGFSGVCSPEILVLRATDRCLPRYLQFVCSLDSTIGRCVEMSAGTRMPRTSSADLATLPMKLPPLSVQKRIVDLVASVDAYIESLQQQVDAARTARNAVLHDLLSAGGDDWTETTLGDVATWGSGGTPKAGEAAYYDGDIPWCVIGDLTEGEVFLTEKLITAEGLANSSAKVVEPGAVLVAMYGASIGRTGLVARPMATNQAIAFAYPKEEILESRFLLLFLQTQKSQFVSAGQGAAQANISQAILKSWPVRLPSLGEQSQIVDLVTSMDEAMMASEVVLSNAKILRSGLLTDLLSGEHEISDSYDRFLGAA